MSTELSAPSNNSSLICLEINMALVYGDQYKELHVLHTTLWLLDVNPQILASSEWPFSCWLQISPTGLI